MLLTCLLENNHPIFHQLRHYHLYHLQFTSISVADLVTVIPRVGRATQIQIR